MVISKSLVLTLFDGDLLPSFKLPGKSGYDILREIRLTPECLEIPVLMLTARGQTKDRQMAEALGASRFMTKPFSNQEMLDAVRELAGA